MWAPSVRLWAAHFGAGIDSLACLYRRSLLAAHPSDLYLYYGIISEIKVVPPCWRAGGGNISFSQSPKRRGDLSRANYDDSGYAVAAPCSVQFQSSPVQCVASLLPVPCLSLPCDATCPVLPTLLREGH
jgi:hypothetical protein